MNDKMMFSCLMTLLIMATVAQGDPLPTLSPAPPMFVNISHGAFLQSGEGDNKIRSLYIWDNTTKIPVWQYIAGTATPSSQNFLLTGDVTPDTVCEIGFIARGNITSGSTYYLAINLLDNNFNIVKVANTTTWYNLKCQGSGITYAVGNTYKLSFTVSGTDSVTLIGNLYLSDGTLVKTLTATDNGTMDNGTVVGSPYTTGTFGPWVLPHEVRAEGHWANLDISAVPGTVTGNVVLNGYTGDKTNVWVTFQFQPVGTGVAVTRRVPLNADGTFSLADIPVGNYTLTVKGDYSLRVSKGSVSVTTSALDLGTINLVNGDANGDNQISFQDFSLMQNSYGQSGKTGADGNFNGDSTVSFEDFCILQNNYGQTGAAAAGAMSPASALATGGCGALGMICLAGLGLAFLGLGLNRQ